MHFARPFCLQNAGGQQYTQASVLIEMDNTDGRFPVDAATITLGRTVGLKKDEYFSNRYPLCQRSGGGACLPHFCHTAAPPSSKPTKKADIINMLESAGFSRSNPYYIVAQGKVEELMKMTAK